MPDHIDLARPSRTFTIVLVPAEDGGFTVTVPALPEVSTCGDTHAEALANAREAIELAIAYRQELGDAIPDAVAPVVEQVTVAA